MAILFLAACFGVAGGLAEGASYTLLSVVPDSLGFKNDLLPQILWIAPVVNLVLFAGVGFLVMAASRLVPSVRAALLACAAFGWLAAYAPFAALGRLQPVTCVLLALGVTFQLCRYVRRRPPVRIPYVAVMSALVLSVLLMRLVGVAFGSHRLAVSVARVTPLAAEPPNVLLIVLDTLRADHVSSYGYVRPTTPNLDRLASQGVLFERAFSAASWTLPSHASIMTGTYPAAHRAGGAPLDSRFPTLAEYLGSRGYATAGFIANNYYCSARTGLGRGFGTYEDHFGTLGDMVVQTTYGKLLAKGLPTLGYYDIPGRKHATVVNRELLEWLDNTPQRPFFIFLNYLDVHDPYIPQRPYDTRFSPRLNKGNRVNSELFPRDFTGGRQLSAEEVQSEIDGYDGALAYLDAQLGVLFDELARRRLLDRTLIIVTSDHGESFGNHGLYGHGNSMYRELLHVPLIVRLPGTVPAGLRLANLVSLQAIPATVVQLAGLESASPFAGTALSSYWAADAPAAADFAFAESLPGIVHNPVYALGRRGAIKSLVTPEWHLILHEEGNVELFRSDDVNERYNVAPENQHIVQELGTRIAALVSPDEWKLFGLGVPSERIVPSH